MVKGVGGNLPGKNQEGGSQTTSPPPTSLVPVDVYAETHGMFNQLIICIVELIVYDLYHFIFFQVSQIPPHFLVLLHTTHMSIGITHITHIRRQFFFLVLMCLARAR